MSNRPHLLAYAVAAILVIAFFAAMAAEPREPSWALRNGWVYRAEVGAALAALLYVPLVALRLAWSGDVFRKIQAPGGAGGEGPAEQLGVAAEEFAQYKDEASKRFAALEAAVEELDARVNRLTQSGSAELR